MGPYKESYEAAAWPVLAVPKNSNPKEKLASSLFAVVHALLLCFAQLLEACMGPYRDSFEGAAWPLLAPRVRSVVWCSSEDDLIWLGIVRLVSSYASALFATGSMNFHWTAALIFAL